ncbi:MAG: DNA polymerase I [Pseudomonadota bacterium]
MPKHLYLVDGSGFIFRAFHALPPFSRPDGTPINAVFGFTNMLMKFLGETDVDHLVIAFDTACKNFRNEIYPLYKANRPPPPEELIPQFPLIREVCKAFNVPTIEMEGFEADDLIATYVTKARSEGVNVTIVSSDKDLMQLVTNDVHMLDPLKNRDIGIEQVIEKFGVPPEKVVDVMALAGDSVDNVPGVAGIGVKTAAELINHYGDLETLLQHTGEIKQPKRRERLQQHAEDARVSYNLVTLCLEAPVTQSIEEFKKREPDIKSLTQFLTEQNFTSILARLEKKGLSSTPQKKEEAKQDYQLVQTESDLKQWIDQIYAAGQVAVDTETTGLNPMQAKLVGFSLAVNPGKACYVPLAHKLPTPDLFTKPEYSKPLQQIELETALSMLRPVLQDPSILKIGQNLKYDALILKRYGVEFATIDDTMVMSYVLDGTTHGHGMDELAKLHLGLTTIKYKDITGTGKDAVTFDYVPLDKACKYAAEDADITAQLHSILAPRLVKESAKSVYETLERPMVGILTQMEAHGICVDARQLKSLSHDFSRRLGELEQEIHQIVGRSFNVGSPKQLGEILFDEMKLPGGKKGKTGAYSTGAEVLETLASLGHELPNKVLDWRQLAKLKSTYTDSLIKQINPSTRRVHTSYAMTVTSTGRLSSSKPNLQNIPIRSTEGLKIRRAFVADPGHQLMSFDYSQIELRIFAHMANIESLRQAFLRGADIHTQAASEIFHVTPEEVDANMRSRAKILNFGIIYGISAVGLARQLRIPKAEAAEHIEHYLERYPGIPIYMEQTKAQARKQGYVSTLFGRRCYIPEILDKNPARRGFAERQAINAPLQGTASDIIKHAMVRIPNALEDQGLKARMLLQVHDELIFEVPEQEIEATQNIVKKIMEQAAFLDVPLTVDIGVGPNWADAKD